ncbi:25728_t:CDS:1, partial [Dentiscutata erythropus]
VEMQLYYPYYLIIVKPNHYDKNKTPVTKFSNHDALLTNNIPDIKISKPLSFGNKIALITKILYEKQRKENQELKLDPDNF